MQDKKRKGINEIGNKYGYLVVVGEDTVSSGGSRRWICRCVCGNTVTRIGTSLRANKNDSSSCGCKQPTRFKKGQIPHNKKEDGYASATKLWNDYRNRAKIRKLSFDISRELFVEMVKKNCHYCNRPPLQYTIDIRKRSCVKKSDGIFYNGLDRKDPKKGYVLDNVVPCCKECNFSKYIKTYEEFAEWIKRTYHYFILGESLWED